MGGMLRTDMGPILSAPPSLNHHPFAKGRQENLAGIKKPAASDARKLSASPPLDMRKPTPVELKAMECKKEEVTQGKKDAARTLEDLEILSYPTVGLDRGRTESERAMVASSDRFTQRQKRVREEGEALLRKRHIQQAVTDAMVANQNDSFDQSVDQVERAPETVVSPLLRLQHKLLDQAQTRTMSSLVASAPPQTDERHLDEDWDADAVASADVIASNHGAGPAVSSVEDAAASGDGLVTESKLDLKEMNSAAKDDFDVGMDQDETKECCICLDAPATHIFVPCGHLCTCAECQVPYANGTTKECPMCRKEFSIIMKVY